MNSSCKRVAGAVVLGSLLLGGSAVQGQPYERVAVPAQKGVDNAESFLKGLGFYFHEVVLTARDERFNTNCVPDFFIMTSSVVRERFNRLSHVASSTAAEGMSDKMVNAVRGVNTSGARLLHDHGFYGAERAILNDACGWSDEAIQVVMDHGKLVNVKPETTWYLLGGG